jgi:hypothetical protein
MNKLVTLAEDTGELLVAMLTLPFVMLLVGMPIVLVARLLLEIVRWLSR